MCTLFICLFSHFNPLNLTWTTWTQKYIIDPEMCEISNRSFPSVTGDGATLRALWRRVDKESRGRTVSLRPKRTILGYLDQKFWIHLFSRCLCECCRVNLALAYTELTEELGRVRSLAVKQGDLLRHVSQEPGRSCFFKLLSQTVQVTMTVLP